MTEKHTKVMDKKKDRNSLRQSTKAFKRARRSAKKKIDNHEWYFE